VIRESTLVRMAVSAALVVALRAAVAAGPPVAEELLALRWLRAVADHPVRSTAALAWLAIGLRRRRTPARTPPPNDGSGEAPGVVSPWETGRWDVW